MPINYDVYDLAHPDVQVALMRLDEALAIRRATALLLTRELGNVSHLDWLSDKLLEHATQDADAAALGSKQRAAHRLLADVANTAAPITITQHDKEHP